MLIPAQSEGSKAFESIALGFPLKYACHHIGKQNFYWVWDGPRIISRESDMTRLLTREDAVRSEQM